MIKIQTLKFLGFWAANSILIWITAQVAPQGLILGNQHILPFWACVFAGYILSTINILVEPTLKLLKIRVKDQSQSIVLSVIINSMGFWVVTRLALMIGVGIPVFWWAVIVGIILTLGQSAISQGLITLTSRLHVL